VYQAACSWSGTGTDIGGFCPRIVKYINPYKFSGGILTNKMYVKLDSLDGWSEAARPIWTVYLTVRLMDSQ